MCNLYRERPVVCFRHTIIQHHVTTSDSVCDVLKRNLSAKCKLRTLYQKIEIHVHKIIIFLFKAT